jgi:cell wall-associated NlpC family hydrolase
MIFLFVFAFFTLSTGAQTDSLIQPSAKMDSLLDFASTFLGTHYHYGSESKKSFDCSGFVRHVYGKFGVELPHGSAAQAAECVEIKLKDVQPGDLLFFSGRKVSRKRIGHVSLVKKVEGNQITMIHATVQSGVIEEVMSNSEYFTKRFIKAGRLKHGL